MRLFKKDKSGMLILDLIISLTIIGFLIWTFGGVLGRLTQNVRETSLRYQLNNFRMLVRVYKDLRGHYPADLSVFVQNKDNSAEAKADIFNKKLLSDLKRDEYGVPLDPFGNRYYYDYKKGVVGSQTKGYENW
jgi:type II secretory pathway pseudopilin PulG